MQRIRRLPLRLREQYLRRERLSQRLAHVLESFDIDTPLLMARHEGVSYEAEVGVAVEEDIDEGLGKDDAQEVRDGEIAGVNVVVENGFDDDLGCVS